MKTLVTHYSRTGTTRAVGVAIARELGADSEEIIDQRKRTGLSPIRYLITGWSARKGQLTDSSCEGSLDDHDMIVSGTPSGPGG